MLKFVKYNNFQKMSDMLPKSKNFFEKFSKHKILFFTNQFFF